jgi:hypothetical protein
MKRHVQNNFCYTYTSRKYLPCARKQDDALEPGRVGILEYSILKGIQ